MKILGLIGGISWVSTLEYYRIINQLINKELGGIEAAECMIYSFNYADIKRNADSNELDKTLSMVIKASNHLKNSGAEAIVLCANTMHIFAEQIEENVKLPLIHIAAATADEINKKKLSKVGLLGTKLTMERDFFKDKLKEKGVEALIPGEKDRIFIHNTIFDELGVGILKPETKLRYISIMNTLIEQGAEGIILGCTEIPLLIQQEDVPVPAFDTTMIHSVAAVNFSLGK